MEDGGCSDGEQEDEAEGEGVTASLPRSVGTLPWLSGGGGVGTSALAASSVRRGLEVVGFVEVSQITPFSGTRKKTPLVFLCKQAAIQHH